MSAAPAEILFIPVVYNSHDDAAEQLANFGQLPGAGRIAVVIVDNSPVARQIASPPERFASLEILSGRGNLGYFGAAREALAYFRQQAALPKWVIISNTDIRIRQPDFIDLLIALHAPCASEKIHCVAPDIRSSKTGSAQNPHYQSRPSAAKFARLGQLFRNYWVAITYRLLARANGIVQGLRRKPAAQRGAIYAPHGSFICLHSSYFAAGGTLDHPAFLYGEEIFIAEQIRRAGGRTLFAPELQAIHHHSVTTGLISNRTVIKHLAEGTRVCATLLAT